MLHIPRILHYVWLGRNPLHPIMQDWQDRWVRLHPGWTIKLWREVDGLPMHFLGCGDELVECRCPDYLAQCPTYAKRSDVWRYEILEQQGGVYLDTDFEPVKCIESYLENVRAFAGLCNTRYGWTPQDPAGKIKTEIGCSIMGCTPHHPWLLDLVAQTPHQDPRSQLSLAFPYLTTLTAKHPDVVLFPPSYFYPIQWDQYALGGRRSLRKEALPPETVAVHRWSSSWFDEGLKPRDAS